MQTKVVIEHLIQISVERAEGIGRRKNMSDAMEKCKEEARKKGYAEDFVEAYAEGRMEVRMDAIRNMIKYGVPREKIAQCYSEEDIEKAINQIK